MLEGHKTRPFCPACGNEFELNEGVYADNYRCSGEKCYWYATQSQQDNLWRVCDQGTFTWRKACHSWFDRLWRSRKMTRDDAYAWLAGELELTSVECHIAHFSAGCCMRVIRMTKEKLAALGLDVKPVGG